MLIGLAAGSMGMMLQQDVFTMRRVVNRMKAREIADGAAHQALGFIANDPSQITMPSAELTGGTMGEGTYNVTLQDVGGGVKAIIAQGSVDNVSQTVKVYLRYPDFAFALQRGIFANGDLIGHGNGTVKNGTHSNQNTDFHGNVEVQGNASSTGTTTLQGAARVTGTVTSGAPRVSFPELDFDHYYQIALQNGQVFYGSGKNNVYMLTGNYSPPGGVMWVVGNVDTKGNTNINGAVFATGNIEDHGKTRQTKFGEHPALASHSGYISFHGNSRFEGLVYAKSGSVFLHGSTAIVGSICAFGDVDSKGNWGQLDYQEQNPQLENDLIVKVLAWEY